MHHPRRVHQPAQTFKMAVVDDAGVIRAFLRLAAVHLGERGAQGIDERFLDPALHQQKIGGNAGLTGVEELAPGDAAGGDIQRHGGVHQTGAFAAEFEGHGGEVFGGGAQHDLAHGGAAGEEYFIKVLLQQLSGDLRPAADRGHVAGVKGLSQNAQGDGLGVRGQLGGLDDDAVAGGHSPHQGGKQQVEGVVPGGKDEGAAVRLWDDAADGRKMQQGGGLAARAHPGGQMAQGVANFGGHRGDFGAVGFGGGFMQIGLQRVQHILFVGLHGVQQAAQLLQAKSQGAGGAGLEKCILLAEQFGFHKKPSLDKIAS